MRRFERTVLLQHRDFMRLWGGQTVSMFGSMISNIAIPFAAIIELAATPFDMGALRIASVAPAFTFGLFAGSIADRTHRKPLMIGADLLRAALLGLIPLFALADVLTIWLLVAVSAGISLLSVLFDVSYQAYLPVLVGRAQLVEANSKLTATASVAESSAFALGGWLVQLLTAPVAILIDALTFVWSAIAIRSIEHREESLADDDEREHLLRDVIAGIRWVVADSRLLVLAGSSAMLNFSSSIFGVLYMLYVTRELGFDPGALGVIFAVGGVSSLVGALLTSRLVDWLGAPLAMASALLMIAAGSALAPLSPEASAVAVGLLVGQQLVVDPAWTLFEISGTSLRQMLTPDQWLGRVNGTFRVIEFGVVLVGTVAGAWIGDEFGLRTALWVAVAGVATGAIPLLLAPSLTQTEENAKMGPA